MKNIVKLINNINSAKDLLLITDKTIDNNCKELSTKEIEYVNSRELNENENNLIILDKLDYRVFIIQFNTSEKDKNTINEAFRREGAKFLNNLKAYKSKEIQLINLSKFDEAALNFAEGLVLANYKFDKYKTKESDKAFDLQSINIVGENLEEDINFLNIQIEATYWSRNLVNEPQSGLDAVKLSEEFIKMGKDAGIEVNVLNKKQIESLKMGGLMGVNKGSVNPPTFTIMEYKPENASNEKPYILVGKGVVFDTGGYNIKTGSYMTDMQMDMAGSAIVSTALYAIAKAKLPIYIIALIPATDNRTNGNAYVPGDVLKMFDGSTVEVLNTDAEGRLILADALAYAKKYNPELVIDAATLTGSAHRAIGHYALAAMQKNADDEISELEMSAFQICERIVEFPLWDDYAESLKSNVADLKNIGGAEAGMITAGKFLEHFTDYPWIHLDIAGPAILSKTDYYRTVGGSGFGTRLLIQFFKNKAK